jgi:PAS domain S-box-containing protein
MRRNAANSDRSDESAETVVNNPFQAALDAADMGTWDWDIRAGRLVWTPRTYQLFGLEPGSVLTSYETFLQSVHEEDRPVVLGRYENAARKPGRTVLEYRIVRSSDGMLRWVRSSGRAMVDAQGKVIRMVGVIEDVTEERQRRGPPSPKPAGNSFSAREVAQILGVAEVSVKRIAAAGEIDFLRSSRKDSRRFAPEQVVEYLRKKAPAGDFASGARAKDARACLLALMEDLLEGASLEDLLDGEVRSAAATADPAFMTDLLSRIPFVVPARPRSGFPALVVRAGRPAAWHAELAGCLLRAHGHEVLSPADSVGLAKLVDVAERMRPGIVVMLVGSDAYAEAVSAATRLSALPRAPTVCLWSFDGLVPAAGVVRIRSLRDLGAILRRR